MEWWSGGPVGVKGGAERNGGVGSRIAGLNSAHRQTA